MELKPFRFLTNRMSLENRENSSIIAARVLAAIESAYIEDSNTSTVLVNGEPETFDSFDRAEEFLEFLKNKN